MRSSWVCSVAELEGFRLRLFPFLCFFLSWTGCDRRARTGGYLEKVVTLRLPSQGVRDFVFHTIVFFRLSKKVTVSSQTSTERERSLPVTGSLEICISCSSSVVSALDFLSIFSNVLKNLKLQGTSFSDGLFSHSRSLDSVTVACRCW